MNPYREHHEEEEHKSTYVDKIKCFFSRHVFHFKERVEIQEEQHYHLFIYKCIHCGKYKTKSVNVIEPCLICKDVCLWKWIEDYE